MKIVQLFTEDKIYTCEKIKYRLIITTATVTHDTAENRKFFCIIFFASIMFFGKEIEIKLYQKYILKNEIQLEY